MAPTTQCEAIIEAFKALGGIRTAAEIQEWVEGRYGQKWKDYSTAMADMVSPRCGGNSSSSTPVYFRVLKRVARGEYTLISND